MSEKTKTRYHVVQETSLSRLHEEVERILALGWKLQGGVSAVGGGSTGTGRAYYHQAMTKEEPIV